MSYSSVYTVQAGVSEVTKITIEADISTGLHNFSIIGLTDKAIDEARDRVGAAIKNSGLTSPKTQNQKITISLAPADTKKEGPSFDLPIAISYLLASKQIFFDTEGICFLGELSLSGELKKIRGVLPIILSAKSLGFHTVYIPKENAHEGSLVDDVSVYAVETLTELLEHLDVSKNNRKVLLPLEKSKLEAGESVTMVDISEVKGQETVKRALLVAAAGGHNIALYGPPGTGKTMLAKAFRGILPELSETSAFEVASIHSVAGTLKGRATTTPPFRSPHHTSSHVAIVGGGSNPKPGEITLAHHGVLFMDEFPEFEKRVLESLREPLEEGHISISRAKGRAEFPADFILIAALNPCPCGNHGNTQKRCICSASEIERYTKKISGPIMDRIDIWVEVTNIPYQELHTKNSSTNESQIYKQRIESARKHQRNRFPNKNKYLNKHLSTKDIEGQAPLSKETISILQDAATKLALSPRSYYKVIKLSRTIADLENSEIILPAHILEALQYRPKIEL